MERVLAITGQLLTLIIISSVPENRHKNLITNILKGAALITAPAILTAREIVFAFVLYKICLRSDAECRPLTKLSLPDSIKPRQSPVQ